MAGDIAERASDVATSVDDTPARFGSAEQNLLGPEDEEPGLLDRLADGDEAVEAIAGVMTRIGEDIELIGEMASRASEEIQVSQARSQGTKRALSITEKFANELNEPASRMEERGREYADLLVRLDSSIQTRFELLEEQDEPLTEDQVRYLEELEDLARNADGALNSLEELVTSIEPLAKVSRSLRAPVRTMRGGLQGVLDGRAVIAGWGKRAESLGGTSGNKK